MVPFSCFNTSRGFGYAMTVVENAIPVVSVTPRVKFVLIDRGLPEMKT